MTDTTTTSKLTQGRLKELLEYNPLTGTFTWRHTARTGKHDAFVLHRAGDTAGSPAGHTYLRVTIDGERHYCHRLAWLYMTGEWPALEIDHRDTDPLNNAWPNLRSATPLLNKQNMRRPRADNESGYLGVSWDASRQKWTARINADGHYKYLGRFDSAQQASRAYIAAKRIFHEGGTL